MPNGLLCQRPEMQAQHGVTLLALLLTRWRARGGLPQALQGSVDTKAWQEGGRHTPRRAAAARHRWLALSGQQCPGLLVSAPTPDCLSLLLQTLNYNVGAISFQPQRSGAARLQRAWAALPAPPARSGDSKSFSLIGDLPHGSSNSHTQSSYHPARSQASASPPGGGWCPWKCRRAWRMCGAPRPQSLAAPAAGRSRAPAACRRMGGRQG